MTVVIKVPIEFRGNGSEIGITNVAPPMTEAPATRKKRRTKRKSAGTRLTISVIKNPEDIKNGAAVANDIGEQVFTMLVVTHVKVHKNHTCLRIFGDPWK
jgi:hypothetical protein